jgi:hypothetical protein
LAVVSQPWYLRLVPGSRRPLRVACHQRVPHVAGSWTCFSIAVALQEAYTST